MDNRTLPGAGADTITEKKQPRPRPSARRRTAQELPRFRTVLVASVGWPTEATPAGLPKRAAKR